MKPLYLLLMALLMSLTAQAQTLSIFVQGQNPLPGCTIAALFANPTGFSPNSFAWSCSPTGPLSATNTSGVTFLAPPVNQPTSYTVTLQASGPRIGFPGNASLTAIVVMQVTPSLGITGQPASASVVPPGSTVSAAVSITANSIIPTFQWYRNGVAVAGQTTPTLTLASVTPAMAGTYVAVVGGCSSFTTTPFVLSVVSRLYVAASQTTNPPDGQTWATAFPTLTAALSASVIPGLGVEIWVAQGLYKPTTTTNRAISFSMRNNLAIYGGFVGNETSLSQRPALNPNTGNPSSSTLSGEIGNPASTTDNSYHVISNPASLSLTNTAVLDGFVVTAGYANGSGASENIGGAVLNSGSNPGNVCSPTFANCLFVNNVAVSGGAMLNDASTSGNSNPIVTNCRFLNNTALDRGGAVFNFGVGFGGSNSPVFRNVSFRGNTAPNGLGGAMFNGGNGGISSPILVNAEFVGNQAANGGAMFNNGLAGSSTPTFFNVSFLNNTATNGGGVFGGDNSFGGNATAQLTNCIAFSNGGANAFVGPMPQVRYSMIETGVTNYSSVVGNLTTTTLPFVSATNLQLPVGSAAINAGNPAATTATVGSTDLAGNPRIFFCRVDMGAYESQTVPTQAQRIYVNVAATGLNTGQSWADAFTDLQSALTYSCLLNPTEIWVAQGTYKPTASTDRTVSFTLKDGMTLYGGFVGNETTLNQRPPLNPNQTSGSGTFLSGDISNPNSVTNGSLHVVKFTGTSSSSAVLDGFGIVRGSASLDPNALLDQAAGGGVYVENSTLMVSNCILRNNQAFFGGGISGRNATLTFTSSVLQNNLASGPGGAIYLSNTSSTLTDCSLLSNQAVSSGGGIYSGSNGLVLTNCTLLSNEATGGTSGGSSGSFGGGIYTTGSTRLTNCYLQSNNAKDGGGAIYFSAVNSTNVTLTNCSLQLNGSFFQVGNAIRTSGVVNLANSVFFSNGGASTLTTTIGGSCVANYSLFEPTVTNYTGANNLTTTTSPFASIQSPQLAAGSSAIGSANVGLYVAANGPSTDIVGNVRFRNCLLDRGAQQALPTGTSGMSSVQNGPWNSVSTWSCGDRLPLLNERVSIGHIVTLPASYVATPGQVRYTASGQLRYGAGSQVRVGQ